MRARGGGLCAEAGIRQRGYPEGIENIAYDSLSGLNAPIFLRTVKLKDYPWNGKLHLGVPDRAEAAWNPVAGFTDAMGRLIWSAVGDPAMIPVPVQRQLDAQPRPVGGHQVDGQSGGIRVPGDALRPQPGTGRCSASATGRSPRRR